MDAPRIRAPRTHIARLCARVEQRQYAKIVGADLVIALLLDPQIAAVRRPEDERESLLRRSAEVWTGTWTEPYMHTIDTGVFGPDEVRQIVIERVWRCVTTPFLRCEIVGHSGVGKTTASNLLTQRHSNVCANLPYRAKAVIAVSILAGLRQFLRSPALPGSVTAMNNDGIAKLRVFLWLEERWRRRRLPASHHYVLDQGPVFLLARSLREGCISTSDRLYLRVEEAIARWAENGIIVLEVPRTTRYARVAQRARTTTQATRSEDLVDAQRRVFDESYEMAYATVLSGLPRVRVVSGTSDPSAVIKAIEKSLSAETSSA